MAVHRHLKAGITRGGILLLALLMLPVVTLGTTTAATRQADALSSRIICNRVTATASTAHLPEMWTVDYAGGNKTLLKPYATLPYNAKDPVYAPNGAWMAFEATDKNPVFKSTAIWLSSFDCTNAGQLTPTMDLSQYGFWANGQPKYSWLFECPTFNSDSTKVYYSATLVQRDQDGNIKYNYENGDPIAYVADTWQVGVDGNGWGPVRPTFEKASEMYPQCSPKSGKVAQTQMMGSLTDFVWDTSTHFPLAIGVAQNEGIFTINPNGSGQHAVVPSYAVVNRSSSTGNMITDRIMPLTCAWSPDGSKLAIVYYVA
ncbi:MAG TPA: hypothetical protein VIK02_07125 [Candidatus Anoxymicrobiaceae bacterium]